MVSTIVRTAIAGMLNSTASIICPSFANRSNLVRRRIRMTFSWVNVSTLSPPFEPNFYLETLSHKHSEMHQQAKAGACPMMFLL